MCEKIIELKKAGKYYHTNGQIIRALHKVNLSFYPGEFVAVTGESGSGKSTLLNAINGLIDLDEGDLFINQKSCFGCSREEWDFIRRKEIGYIYQEYDLIEHYSVWDNLIGMLQLCGVTENLEEKTEESLKQVGLLEYKHQKAGDLSSGQKQRLAIARAVIKCPEVILADEPTGNLDAENSKEILKLLAEISKHCLVIMVTHDYELTKDYVTRKIVIQNGSVVGDTAIKEYKAAKREHQLEIAENWKKTIFFFVQKNILGNKARCGLFFVLYCTIAVISLVSIGQIYIYKDDHIARNQDDSIFSKNEDNRILVKKHDNKKMTDDNLREILELSNVVDGDLFGIVNDIQYTTNKWDEEKTVQSVSAIKEEEILKGKMPKKRDEVAVSQNLNLQVGDEVKCKLYSANYYGRDEFIADSFKVVGIVDDQRENMYFSLNYCDMLSVALCGGGMETGCAFDKEKGEYQGFFHVMPVIMDEAKGQQAVLSERYDIPAVVRGYYEGRNEIPYSGSEMIQSGDDRIPVEYADFFHESSSVFLGVSESVFLKCFKDYGKNLSTEISIHITNYAKTDQVIHSLERKGYDAVNTYRISSREYNADKAAQRMEVLEISIGVLIIMFFIQLLIQFVLLRLKNHEVAVFCKLGMKQDMLYTIFLLEQVVLFVMAFVSGLILFFGILGNLNESVAEMCSYYSLSGIGGAFLYNIVCVLASNYLYLKSVRVKRSFAPSTIFKEEK